MLNSFKCYRGVAAFLNFEQDYWGTFVIELMNLKVNPWA